MSSLAPLSKAEIRTVLPDVSPATVEALFGRMGRGQIQRLGVGKSSRYIRVPLDQPDNDTLPP
jgi:hypothetical protein